MGLLKWLLIMVTPPSWPEEGPRRSPLTEAQFSEVLSEEGVEYIQEIEFLRCSGVHAWVERRLYALYRKSTDLETFLDDHGAPANQTFFRVRELVAGTRWLAMTCSCLVHLRSRLGIYPPANADWVNGPLKQHLQEAIDCFGGYLLQISESLSVEWVKVGLRWDNHTLGYSQEALGPDFVLPANRLPESDERAEASQKATLPAARVIGRVLRILGAWSPLASVPTGTHEERRAFMEDFCSEATARDFESRIHNLQSDYDSTIRGSKEEEQFPELLQLRGAISQCLHLLEAVTALAHLYERHEVRQRHPATRRVLEGIIQWEEFLDCMIRCCVLPALYSLLQAKALGEKLLDGLTTQAFRDVEIPHGIALHARPLSLIVGVVHHYGLPIEIEIEEERASAASMMSMLVLCGSHLGANTIRFHGDPAVLEDLHALFEARLGEDGIDALPSSLKYLIR